MRNKWLLFICSIVLAVTTFGLPYLTMSDVAFADDEPVQLSAKAPAVPTVKSVTNSAYKQLYVEWTEVSGADGYELYRKATGYKSKTYVTKPKGYGKLKGLLPDKSYTVKVRSFKIVKGKKIRSDWSKSKTIKTDYKDWASLLEKYQAKEDCHEIILVKYKGNSKADLILYKKNEAGLWDEVLACNSYTGKNGIDKKKEGDKKTPTGIYKLNVAFGIKDDPGSAQDYIKVNNNLYWCADKYYNQMVDVKEKPHKCSGEHLINYTKQYAYAMALNYNSKCIDGKGSAIFLHCFGNYQYTLGCIAVSESNMKTILQLCETGTRICIYKK